MFMNLLDLTIVNVAVPVFTEELDATTSQVQWVVTAYLISVAVFIPVSGWAGDRFGTKRVFLAALTLFTAGSALCAAAWDVESLIAFRALQGMGGGLLMPVAQTMVFRSFPQPERALAAGILVVPTTIAPASGPLIGGLILDHLAWQWIFLVNVPVGVAGIVLSMLFLREHREPSPGRFDAPGFLLAAAGLALLLFGLSEAGGRGFDEVRVLGFGGAGIASLVAFVFYELREPDPLIDVRLFLNRMFSVANATQSMAFMGFSATLFLLPLFLQLERGMSPLQSGLVTFPQAIGVMMMAPVMTRFYPRIGPRRLVVAGLVLASLTTIPLVQMDLESNLWTVRGAMLLRGMGFGFMLIPLQTAAFATISMAETGRATAVFNATRQVAQSFGVAIGATVLTSRLAHHDTALGPAGPTGPAVDAFSEAFLATLALSALGVAVAFLIRDREAAPTMRPPKAVAPTPEERSEVLQT